MRKLGILIVLAVLVFSFAPSADAAGTDVRLRMETALRQMETAAGGPLEVTRSRVTGLASFVRTRPGHAIPVDATATTAEARALSFLKAYGPAFGLAGSDELAIVAGAAVDGVGMHHVRLQQRYRGIPVTGAELVVHLRGASVVAASAKVVVIQPGLVGAAAVDADVVGAGFDTQPQVSAGEAQQAVRQLLRKQYQIEDAALSAPRLEVLNRGLLQARPSPSALVWFVEARTAQRREFVWVDAHRGGILLHFDQMPHGRNRTIYDAESAATLPGTLLRVEGGAATGDTDADLAYQFAGDTYDYYWTQLGRDSFDDAGAELRSSVHYCPTPADCPYANAGWNGAQMVYGDGFASADDVVAHELTHAVTEYSANLFYYMQSGAMNESFSDIFGESVDLSNGHGNDDPSVRWLMGEDMSIGAIRNMMDPTIFSDPGRVSDANFYCGRNDNGGVHWNSGVLNHSYALVVDGGTYNTRTVTAIGLAKAGKIYYRALNYYLVSGSDFLDAYTALNQSCTDLVGTSGITAADCTQLTSALDAVELSSPWPCAPAQPATPALCAAGQVAQPLWTDDLEDITSGNWSLSVLSGTDHWSGGAGDGTLYWSGFSTSGSWLFWGWDAPSVGDSAVAMTSSVTLPAAARLQFNHAYDIETNYDGGVIEYSTDGGGTWNDAGSMITAGAPYNGVLSAGNPLAGRQAFTNLSYGYTASQLDLSSLAGQSARFRFRMATDSSAGYNGWFLDDVRIYACSATANTLSVSKAGTGGGTVVSEPAGIACGADCTEDYGLNAVVNLTAGPDPGSSFIGWTGACAGALPTCQVTMDAAKSVTATFDVPASWQTLTVTKAGTGSGTVVSSPPGIDCGSQCSASFGTGSTVTLTAIPDVPGFSTFDGWSGAGCSGTGTCVVTMDAARDVTATFSGLPVETLTVTKTGTGSGTVTSSPLGIDCGTQCSANFVNGSVVTLTAGTLGYSRFDGWSGEGCSGTGTCVVTMDAARAVTATFTAVTVLYDNGPRVSCAGCGSGGADASVLETALGMGSYGWNHGAAYGYRAADDFPVPDGERWAVDAFQTFAYQTGAPTGASPITSVNLQVWNGQPPSGTTIFGDTTTNRLGSSSFSNIYRVLDTTLTNTQRALWADTAMASTTLDAGTYWLDWQTGGSLASGPWVPPIVISGQTTTGNAIQYNGSAWAAILDGSSATPQGLPFLVIGSRSYRLRVALAGAGTGAVTSSPGGIACGATCSEFFAQDSTVTLTAVTSDFFGGWSGGGCSGTGTCVVTMDAAKDVTATFLPPCHYSIDPASVSIGAAGGTATVNVTAEAWCPWTVTSNEPTWLTVPPGSSGTGNGSFDYTVALNAAGARTGTITVATQTFTVDQAAAACSYSIDPTSANPGAAGGSGSVNVTTGSWCGWTATSNNLPWLAVTSGSPGTGNGSVGYTVAVNDAGARTGTITVADQTFTVNQAAAACSYSIDPTSANPGAAGGSGSVNVTTGSWCGWTATSNNLPWLAVTSGSPGTGNGSVGYTVAVNDAGARTGTITVADQTFTVNQAAAACSYSIVPTSVSPDAAGGSGSVNVTTGSWCGWTATSNNLPWLTVTSGSPGTGNGSVGYTVAVNDAGARTGTITVADQTFTVNQAAAACSYSIDPTSANPGAAGGSGSVNVTTGSWCDWTATSNNLPWLTVTSGSPGTGNGSVGYTVAVNDGAARTGTITVADQTFTVNQAAAACHYTLVPASAGIDWPGGSGAFDVTAESWCDWTATSNDSSWLTVTSGSPGSGNGSVGYSATANSTGARAGTITVADQTFTVTQAPRSDRELAHGSDAWQSLAALAGVAHVDYYRVAQQPYASYEVVVESAAGDVQPVQVERLAADETTVLPPASQAIGMGAARSLRWRNALSSPVTSESIRVRSGGSCSTDCGADDTYRIRCYETTAAIPRFNNASTQVTVLILQNPTDYTITGTSYFWSAAGALLASSDFTLVARQTLVLSTPSLAGLVGQSGSITIAHDGRYGDLVGKSVALEPGTGFSFDSPMAWRSIR